MSDEEIRTRRERRAEQRAATFAERRAERRTAASAVHRGPSRARRIGFWAGALIVSAVAVGLVVTRLAGPTAVDAAAIQVHASMGGFDPSTVTVKAGQPFSVELASMDTSMHSDGGGWHEFAIAELGIDWKVGPESSKVFDAVAPATPGTYTFYCDICCGGKENPSMQGKFTVVA